MIKMIRQKLKNQKGLTLIELLAVVVILGIIAAIAVPSIGNLIQKSRVDAVKSDAVQVLQAAKIYVASNGIPAENKIPNDDLKKNVESEHMDKYTVTVSDEGVYQISGTVTAGKKDVVFTNATISDINKSKDETTITGTTP
jgi:type IV pilus assembly protein PilA